MEKRLERGLDNLSTSIHCIFHDTAVLGFVHFFPWLKWKTVIIFCVTSCTKRLKAENSEPDFQ